MGKIYIFPVRKGPGQVAGFINICIASPFLKRVLCLQPDSSESWVLRGAFPSVSNFIARAKGQSLPLGQGAEDVNAQLQKWSCCHCWGCSSDLNRYRRASPQELPCLAPCSALWEKRAQAPGEFQSRISDQFVWQLRAFYIWFVTWRRE